MITLCILFALLVYIIYRIYYVREYRRKIFEGTLNMYQWSNLFRALPPYYIMVLQLHKFHWHRAEIIKRSAEIQNYTIKTINH